MFDRYLKISSRHLRLYGKMNAKPQWKPADHYDDPRVTFDLVKGSSGFTCSLCKVKLRPSCSMKSQINNKANHRKSTAHQEAMKVALGFQKPQRKIDSMFARRKKSPNIEEEKSPLRKQDFFSMEHEVLEDYQLQKGIY